MNLSNYEIYFIKAALKTITQLAGLMMSFEKLDRRRQTWIDVIYQCDQIMKKL